MEDGKATGTEEEEDGGMEGQRDRGMEGTEGWRSSRDTGTEGRGSSEDRGMDPTSPYLHVLPVEAHHGGISHQQRLHVPRLGDEALGPAERLPGAGGGGGGSPRGGGPALEAVQASPGGSGPGMPEGLELVSRPVEEKSGSEPSSAAAERGGGIGAPLDGSGVEAAPARRAPSRWSPAPQALEAEAGGQKSGVGAEAEDDGSAEGGQPQGQLPRGCGQAGGQQGLRLPRRRRQRPRVAQQQQVERSPAPQQQPPPPPPHRPARPPHRRALGRSPAASAPAAEPAVFILSPPGFDIRGLFLISRCSPLPSPASQSLGEEEK